LVYLLLEPWNIKTLQPASLISVNSLTRRNPLKDFRFLRAFKCQGKEPDTQSGKRVTNFLLLHFYHKQVSGVARFKKFFNSNNKEDGFHHYLIPRP
jgi:hypothetical protein